MISAENRKLIEAIKAPTEYEELISTIIDSWRDYRTRKGYFQLSFKPVANDKYFCAYVQGAAPRGEGAAIIGFENKHEGLCLVFHQVVVDLKHLTKQTDEDIQNGWRRIHIDKQFTDDEVQHICKLSNQCIDKAFA